MKDITINDLKALVSELNEATDNYDVGCPIMTDAEWDDKYYTLIEWERILNTILPNSPTIRINSKVSDKLEKVEHNHPMLSLSKTKDLSVLENFINSTRYIIMAKMDGLTCSLTYRDGNLFRAETRGNGIVGENITSAAIMVPSIPKSINIKDEVIIDGEIICTYSDFTKWSNKFANPRNFAAGSIRLLDNKEVAARNLTFVAWDCIEGINENSLFVKLDTLEKIGFIVVPRFYWTSFGALIEAQINQLKRTCSAKGYPIDGVVVKYDECDYYSSLGATAHHPLAAMAFKFYDESYPTKLIDIEWTMGRTGSLTPVAIFDMVEIDGCEVTRASLHNVSIMKEILHGLGYRGQPIKIEKRNEIIPQIAWAANPLHDNKGED